MTAMPIQVTTARALPRSSRDELAVGYPVGTSGPVPKALGLSRAALAESGFEGKIGQSLVIPAASGLAIAVGIGDPAKVDVDALRAAAGCLVRVGVKRAALATTLADVAGVDPALAGQAVTEAVLLASYRFERFRSEPKPSSLESVTLVVSAARESAVKRGIARGETLAAATTMARDLANTPPGHLTARMLADIAVSVAAENDLAVDVFNKDQLLAMGCGGIVGVNGGSAEPPRMVRLRYTPKNASGHLVLVGKGVMYDSGGISLKPSNDMHAQMKMDMTGAAAVLSAMSVLQRLKCKTAVTGYLMCTDNMPSGSALKLGDVLRFRNGKTAEIFNTDAEGRLVLADGLSLAVEEQPDAIVDIATLTGACLVALGPKIAGMMSTNDSLAAQVSASAAGTGEPVWRLPLEPAYRKLLDSNIADFKNVGGPYGGAITAGLFLKEFVAEVPWAHLDIAGPMNSDSPDGLLTKGATGFGARLLADLATNFTKPDV